MKKLLSLAFAIMMIACISAQEQANVVVFDETTHDFGVIKEEDGRVTTVFNFTNTTQGPLTITNVRASCGCTTPAWNKEPIAPEGQGQITVSYNAKGRPLLPGIWARARSILAIKAEELKVQPLTASTSAARASSTVLPMYWGSST